MNPFVIWFEERSGSSHLVSLLDAHSEIYCLAEVFDGHQLPAPVDLPEGEKADLSDRYRRVIKARNFQMDAPTREQCIEWLTQFFETPDYITGFKFKHPKQQNLFPEVSDFLQQYKSLKVIALRRENLIRRVLSRFNRLQIQKTSGTANLSKGKIVNLDPLYVDLDEFMRILQKVQDQQEGFETWLEKVDQVYPVEYEDLCRDPTIIDSVQSFLGVTRIETLQSRFKKATDNRLDVAIRNYREFSERMNNEGFGKFLED